MLRWAVSTVVQQLAAGSTQSCATHILNQQQWLSIWLQELIYNDTRGCTEAGVADERRVWHSTALQRQDRRMKGGIATK
jgi:hypothetical protein